MKYYISEGENEQKFNATNKARSDAEKIFEMQNFKKIVVPTKYKRETNKLLKIKQIRYLISNYFVWKRTLKVLNENDTVVIQYPILNSLFGLNKILKKLKKRKINTVLLIHDLDSLRNSKKNIILKEDYKNLNSASKVIVHNDKMKNEVEKMNVDSSKIIVLGVFDYLFKQIDYKNRNKDNEIIIAGNLSKQKTKYIEKLNKLSKIKFNLYGIGYEKSEEDINIKYCGKFPPEELLNELDGSFGLIWDGDSLESCTGNLGNYLRFNNPHKTSLYLAAGIPVIVWSKSAISDFVNKNNVGITVDSLYELEEKITNIKSEEYSVMLDNAKKLSAKLKEGYFLSNALNSL